MDDRKIRLRCVEIAGGDLFVAKHLYHWVDGLEEDQFIATMLHGSAE